MSSAGTGTAAPSSSRTLFKEMARGSGIYLAGSVLQRLASVLVVPITTRCLTPAEFGVADLLEQCTSVLSMLLGARFGSAIGYFYFKKESTESRRAIVTTSIWGAILLGAAATLLCRPFSVPLARFVFGDAANARYFNYLLLLMPATFATEAAFSLLRVENRPIAFTVLSLLRLGLQIVGIVIFVAMLKLHVIGIVYTSCIAAALVGVLMSYNCLRRFPARFDSHIFVDMMKYSLPLGLAGVAMFFVHVGDRFFLPHYRSLGDLGIYVLAYKFGMLLSFFFSAFYTYWSAQIFPLMRREDSADVFKRVATYAILGLSFGTIALIVCSRPALRIFVARPYWSAEGIIPVITVAYFARGIGDFFRCIFYVENRPGYEAICNWVAAAVCAAGYVLLIPKFGIWGAGYTTLFVFLLLAVISMVWSYRVRRYRLEVDRLLKIGIASAAAIVPYAIIPNTSLPSAIASAMLSMALFPLALWILRFPTRGEWHTAINAWGRVREKYGRA